MRVLLQRVTRAGVKVEGEEIASIGSGLLLFLGVTHSDTKAEAQWLIDKVTGLRIFYDQQGKMNLSVTDIKSEIIVVSQFTLYGDCRKGRRPGFDKAAPPELANKLYEFFIEGLRAKGIKVGTGIFGAHMEVSLVNDGPVTFILDSPVTDRRNSNDND